MRGPTAVAAILVTAGALVLAWNAGNRPEVPVSAAGVPLPSHSNTPAPPSRALSSSSPPAAAPPPAPAPFAAPLDRQVSGPTVSTRYGPVQVQVVLHGTTITDVVALQLTNSNRPSVQISAQSAPVLRQEALRAQSAAIDVVSGATYTSSGYQQSLQAAPDAAHV